jgi:AcrR family transcriptional regulator
MHDTTNGTTNDTTDRPYHHGDLRRVIIDSAMDMLQEGGGWRFTLRELARRAGVSHAAPYKHFPDKAALLTELALIGFDRLRETLIATTHPASTTVREQFVAAARAYVGFAMANPALYRLMFGADAGKPADVHLNERALGAFGVLLEMLQHGQDAGALRKRPIRGQAAACWAQIHGAAMLTIDGLLLPEKVGPNALDAALAALFEGLETREDEPSP